MLFKGKTALITGATAGIGEACADKFASEGANLILLARREERLNDLSKTLSDKYGIKVKTQKCDVRNFDEVKNAIEAATEDGTPIDFLINNAGLARGLSKIHEGDLDDWNEMLDTNVKGLLHVSRVALPKMVARNEGTVVNIASIAGWEVYPNGNVYCASKSAARAISKSMNIDLNGTNIRTCCIDPGLVETEFSLVRFHGDEDRAGGTYKGIKALEGRDIAEIASFVCAAPPHVMIQDVLVTPTCQASTTMVHRGI
ncbi:MAG: SDR family NAD(P)-dependent oxidoreductase [Chloroflexota bacterium]